MRAGAVVSALSLIFTVIGSFSLKHDMMTANAQKLADHQITASQISRTATGLIIYTIVIGLVSIGLWLWMARMNEAGRRWARITASVFFALWSLYTYSVIGELHGGVTVTGTLIVSMILILALWVIGAMTIFYLWRPASTAYFKAQSATAGPR
jgi:protein-S-isoprenylcysteine O-methyltransferase Ste14